MPTGSSPKMIRENEEFMNSDSTNVGGPNPWLVLFSVGLGLFMVVIDVSILNIALPQIADSLDATMASIQWTLIGLSLIHISEPTRRTPISYAVFCLKKK